MSALSESLGNDAAAHTLIHNGRIHTVRLIDQTAKTRFEKWLFGRARDLEKILHEERTSETARLFPAGNDEDKAVLVKQQVNDADIYQATLEALNDDYIAGVYAFESKLAAKALQTPAGLIALSADLFGVTREDMFRLVVERGPEVEALISLVMKESLPQAPQAKAGPGND